MMMVVVVTVFFVDGGVLVRTLLMDGDENSPKKGAQKGNMLLQLMDMDMSCS